MIESLNPSTKPTPELQAELNELKDNWEVARLNGASFEHYQRKIAMIAFTLSERERLDEQLPSGSK